MNTLKNAVTWMLIASLTSACTTALWEDTNPQEFVDITNTAISIEELKRQDIAFYVDQKSGRIFMEKSGMDRFKNYSLRALGTPVTLAVDIAGFAAATTAGVIYIVAMAHGNELYTDQVERIQWDQSLHIADPNIPLR
jgi:hypothetical protein